MREKSKPLALFILAAALAPALAEGADAPSKAVLSAPSSNKAEALASTSQSTKTVGDWVVKCSQIAEGRKTCVMSQTLSNAKSRRPISVWSIGRNPAGKLTGTIRMPTGVSLRAGVVVGTENSKTFNVGYSTCVRFGCFAPFELTTPLMDRFRKTSRVTAVAQIGNRPLSLSFSLRGFPKAYETFLQETK